MSLSHETVLELMSLADGELEGDDQERVEQLVASSDEARRVVEAMRRGDVGTWLATSMDERAGKAGADGDRRRGDGRGREGRQRAVEGQRLERGRRRRVDGGRGRGGPRVSRSPCRPWPRRLALAAAVALYVRAGGDQHRRPCPRGERRAFRRSTSRCPRRRVAQAEPSGGSRSTRSTRRRAGSRSSRSRWARRRRRSRGPSSVVVWVDDDPGSK